MTSLSLTVYSSEIFNLRLDMLEIEYSVFPWLLAGLGQGAYFLCLSSPGLMFCEKGKNLRSYISQIKTWRRAGQIGRDQMLWWIFRHLIL